MDGSPEVLRVVVADDDEATAYALADLLTLMLTPPPVVEVALDGRSALEAATNGSSPHVVLLDVDMPLMSGPEVAAQIRESSLSEDPLLVAITAHPAAATPQASELFRTFDHVMQKPVDVARLAPLMNRVRNRRS